jgi:hypothetical protein
MIYIPYRTPTHKASVYLYISYRKEALSEMVSRPYLYNLSEIFLN